MNFEFTRHGFALATEATAIFHARAPQAFAEAMTLTDIVECEVNLRDAQSRIINVESMTIYDFAFLTTDDLK